MSEVPIVIGFTGRRGVGKSEAAQYLVDCYGFTRVHPFGGGKKAIEAWLRYYGVNDNDVSRMVHGDLKNAPSEHLPGKASQRFFAEKFGQFLGVQLGVEWTLGMEIQRVWKQNPRRCIVVESLVYEAALVRGLGGRVVKIERPGIDIEAVETDRAVAALEPDLTLINDGTLMDLYRQIDDIFQVEAGEF